MSNDKPHAQAAALASESQRIREIFATREEPGDGPIDLFRYCLHQEREQALLFFFREIGLTSLNGLRILDVGCGSGGQLRHLTDFGAQPENCFGIDLFQPSLARARRQNPNITFIEGSAARLPFTSGEFDLVLQFTVLTSVLDAQIRLEIVSEIQRVLRPGGYFIWYDFAYSNPKNPNVRGIGRREISQLLKGFSLRFRKITLAPPIGRRAVKISPFLYRALAAIPPLRTHYFCFAQKPGAEAVARHSP
jgi:ubiquinone/menaquinone biosynthesis C-methylase UbiE